MNAPTPAAILTRAAPLAATSWNAEARTFEVVFSTGAPVERSDARGIYVERLSLAQDWSSFVGAPVLDAHRRGAVSDVLGSVIAAVTVGGEARATVRLSRRPDVEPVLQDILDGHLRGVSVGYAVQAWREDIDPATGIRTRTAVRWTAVELSIVPIPADPSSFIRSSDPVTTPTPAAQTEPAALPAVIITPPAPVVMERAAVNVSIRSIATVAGLDRAWADTQIDGNATVEMARAAAFDAMQVRAAAADPVRTTRIEVGASHDDPELRVRAAGEAMFARFTPGHQVSERARQFVGMTTLDLARDSLRLRSISTTGLSAGTIIERALHTTSDFPLILGDSINRTLREAYRAAPSGLKRVGRPTTAKDFRAKHRLALSEAPRLVKTNEAGEFQAGTLAEAEEVYKLATFGRIINISRQAVVNDDLSAFADLARRMGQAAAATEAQLLVDLILANGGNGPTMSDGKALFHTAHKNISGAGAPLSISTLSAARSSMRKQVGLSGELIQMEPKYLVVPPELETYAEQLLASLQATKAEDVNPFSSKLSLVVEPRLDNASRWYVTADPAMSDGLEYSYLEGQEGVQLETKYGFEVDGVSIRARLDFGAGFVDFRSWYRNAGV